MSSLLLLHLVHEYKCYVTHKHTHTLTHAQEEKYKYYYNQLSHLVHEYEGIVGRLQPTIKPLLRPHLLDMETKIAPGFSLLVWTSMNIDGYMHRFKQVCAAV